MFGCLIAVALLGCGDNGANAGTGGSADSEGTSSGRADGSSSSTGAPACETEPRVLVWLELNTGGLVSATVEYSVDGGPRTPAVCQQGACFIYEGAEQPITVYAQYEDCDEQELSTFGASCDAEVAAEISFGFYDGCSPATGGWDTDMPMPETSTGG